jgi:hypothetical protein
MSFTEALVMPPHSGNALQRITALEVHSENMAVDIKDMRHKVDEMHNVLMQAKGARWAIVSVAGFAGFLSGALAKIVPFLQK